MSFPDTLQMKPHSYEVRNSKDQLVAVHHRLDTDSGKRMWWTQPDGSRGLNGTSLASLPLYGSERVADWPEEDLVVLVEGEKARDALAAAGLPALGTVTGAGHTPGSEALQVLRGRRVCLWPDSDEPGKRHMRRIAEALQDMALEVLWFTWHEAPEDVKGPDAADYPALKKHDPKAADRLLTELEGAPRWTPEDLQAEPIGRLLSEVRAEQVDWVWPRRIPRGKLSIWEGDPGVGKSAATTDVAARVSAGHPWPDGTPGEAGGVVLLSAKDGLADTIRPRLEAAGGDPSKVLALATVCDARGERLLSIPEDLSFVRLGIERVDALLVVVDPLMAFLSGGVNSHRDQDVRRALAPLAALAEDTGAAVVVVRHLTKAAGGHTLYRGGGSIGIIGAARSALLVAKHPEDENLRVLAGLKSNLGPLAPSLAFTLAGTTSGAVRVEWKGETPHTAAALLAPPADPEERSALAEAKDFLRNVLGDGPRWSKTVMNEARDAEISEITLKRAKRELGIISSKQADGTWIWRLPEREGIEGGQAPKDDLLDPVEHVSAAKSRSSNQEDQGYQGDRTRSGERLAIAGNGYYPSEHCSHDVPGMCWSYEKSPSEGYEEVPS